MKSMSLEGGCGGCGGCRVVIFGYVRDTSNVHQYSKVQPCKLRNKLVGGRRVNHTFGDFGVENQVT